MTDQRRRITAAEAPDAAGVPAATVRSWAYRQRLYSCGIDPHGRPLYWLDDLTALRDEQRPTRAPA